MDENIYQIRVGRDVNRLARDTKILYGLCLKTYGDFTTDIAKRQYNEYMKRYGLSIGEAFTNLKIYERSLGDERLEEILCNTGKW